MTHWSLFMLSKDQDGTILTNSTFEICFSTFGTTSYSFIMDTIRAGTTPITWCWFPQQYSIYGNARRILFHLGLYLFFYSSMRYSML